MVPRSLLLHYCHNLEPTLALLGRPFVFETTRPVLTLFFDWLYTGKVDTADWHDTTELYFLGSLTSCVAFTRTAILKLQKVCRPGSKYQAVPLPIILLTTMVC
jgi:hypothetical protein